jgi:hypothetical protein
MVNPIQESQINNSTKMAFKLTKRKKKILLIFTIISTLLLTVNFLVEKEVHVKRELTINKSIDEVWEIMGHQYGQVDLWSTNFIESNPSGKPKFPGLNYSKRITLTERGRTIQELDAFDPVNHTLTYHITEGAPSISKKASATWSLISIDSLHTKVVFKFNMTTKGIVGFIMANTIDEKLGSSAKDMAEELKYYLENGSPHPRKIKSKN